MKLWLIRDWQLFGKIQNPVYLLEEMKTRIRSRFSK